MKRLLCGVLFGVVVAGCQSIPIIDKMDAPTARVERFYLELQEAKVYRASHQAIEAQRNYRSNVTGKLPELQ
jgi:hypothetical protein